MTLTNTLKGAAGALLALALLPGAARAGNLLSTATVTYGIGDLTFLSGTLNSTMTGSERSTAYPSTSNLYEIMLTGTPFSATTVGTTGNPLDPTTDIFDTSLYLFDSAGRGLLMNDDDPTAFGGDEARSTLSSSALGPGLYYLGISVFQYVPLSGGGLMFPDETDPALDRTQTYGPTGPGGAGTLSGWRNQGADLETGTFGIALVGARAAAVPEPAPAALLLAGAGLLLLGVRRRKAATS